MYMKKLPALLLASVTMLGLGVGSAFAQGTSGYAFPNFWGTQASQVPSASTASGAQGTAASGAQGAAIHAYATQTSQDTYLFPPNPNSGSGS